MQLQTELCFAVQACGLLTPRCSHPAATSLWDIVSSVYSLCHIGPIFYSDTYIRTNINVNGQICSDMTQLSRVISL